MLDRYARPEMTEIWTTENRFKIWLEIEAHACDAQAELGVIPKEAAKAVWEKGAFDVARVAEIEAEVKPVCTFGNQNQTSGELFKKNSITKAQAAGGVFTVTLQT